MYMPNFGKTNNEHELSFIRSHAYDDDDDARHVVLVHGTALVLSLECVGSVSES